MTIFSGGSEESQALLSSHQLAKKQTVPLTLQITCSAAIRQQTAPNTQIIMW